MDTAAPKAKAQAKVQAKSKVKAKAAGKAKAAASKAPGVPSSPMKAPKAEAKSTMKKILQGLAAALPNPELKAIAKARANTVKEMAARDEEPVSDDHAEGEQEEPKEEEATVADDDRQGSGTE